MTINGNMCERMKAEAKEEHRDNAKVPERGRECKIERTRDKCFKQKWEVRRHTVIHEEYETRNNVRKRSAGKETCLPELWHRSGKIGRGRQNHAFN